MPCMEDDVNVSKLSVNQSLENILPTLDSKELADYFGFIETDSTSNKSVEDMIITHHKYEEHDHEVII